MTKIRRVGFLLGGNLGLGLGDEVYISEYESPEPLNELDISGFVLVLALVEYDISDTLSNSPGFVDKLPSMSACGTV